MRFLEAVGLTTPSQRPGMHRSVFHDNYRNLNFSKFSNSEIFPCTFSLLLAWFEKAPHQLYKGIPIVRILVECPKIEDKSEKVPGKIFELENFEKLKFL